MLVDVLAVVMHVEMSATIHFEKPKKSALAAFQVPEFSHHVTRYMDSAISIEGDVAVFESIGDLLRQEQAVVRVDALGVGGLMPRSNVNHAELLTQYSLSI